MSLSHRHGGTVPQPALRPTHWQLAATPTPRLARRSLSAAGPIWNPDALDKNLRFGTSMYRDQYIPAYTGHVVYTKMQDLILVHGMKK